MFGLAAIHKFASWDKVDLLRIIIPFLSDDEINEVGGKNKGSSLHFAIEMNALNAFKFLMNCPRIDKSIVNINGKTASQLALDLNIDLT